MRKKKALVLVHQGLVPPNDVTKKEINREKCEWVTEYDVVTGLRKLKHEVQVIGVMSDLKIIRNTIEEFRPQVVVNLMEMFDGETTFDQNVVSYLQLLRTPYTGCNPRGLILARDKALTKKVLKYHRLRCPQFFVFPRNKRLSKPKKLNFPLIVKCLREEASYGISQASVVHNEEKLLERVQYIHTQLYDDAIAEEFIKGRELYCGILGNYRLKALPVWELNFDKGEEGGRNFYTRKAKFNEDYRKEKGIYTDKAELSKEKEIEIQTLCKKAYKVLGLNGYARIDLRMNAEGKVYVIEANPNPDIAETDDFAASALYAGTKYKTLLDKILSLGISWHSSYL